MYNNKSLFNCFRVSFLFFNSTLKALKFRHKSDSKRIEAFARTFSPPLDLLPFPAAVADGKALHVRVAAVVRRGGARQAGSAGVDLLGSISAHLADPLPAYDPPHEEAGATTANARLATQEE